MGKLADAIANLEEHEAIGLVRDGLTSSADPMGILEECRLGMDIVGQRYEAKDYFLSELVMSGEIFQQVAQLIEPALKGDKAGRTLGKVVVGTVSGDVHDIGKNIVVTMLACAGFDVYDVGIDAPAEKFIETIRETGSTVVGMSGLLTTSFDPMKQTVDALKEAGLRDKVKVILGGGPVNEQVREYAGADYVGKDALEAVELCRRILVGVA